MDSRGLSRAIVAVAVRWGTFWLAVVWLRFYNNSLENVEYVLT